LLDLDIYAKWCCYFITPCKQELSCIFYVTIIKWSFLILWAATCVTILCTSIRGPTLEEDGNLYIQHGQSTFFSFRES
jgi:hypothetical protein